MSRYVLISLIALIVLIGLASVFGNCVLYPDVLPIVGAP